MQNTSASPTIVVLAHRRADHLFQVVESLRAASGFSRHRVLGIVDGEWPDSTKVLREGLDPQLLIRVRHEGHLHPRNRIARNLQIGLDLAFNHFSSPYCIVLEDDIVVSDDFLDFVAAVHAKHAKNPLFRAVNGFSKVSPKAGALPSDYVRLNYGVGWGWALPRRSYRQVQKLLARCGDFHWDGLVEPFMRTGYVVNPLRSRVINIGFDGSGAHTGSEEHQNTGRQMASSLLGPSEWRSTSTNLRLVARDFPWRQDVVPLDALGATGRLLAYGNGVLLFLLSALRYGLRNSPVWTSLLGLRRIRRLLLRVIPRLAAQRRQEG